MGKDRFQRFYRILARLSDLADSLEQFEPANLGAAIQRLSTLSSAEYVLANFGACEVFDSKEMILEYSIAQAELSGVVLEFGVYTGDSLSAISELSKQEVHGFDSFQGLPQDWRSGFKKGHFAIQGLPTVKSNVRLHVGLFSETLPGFARSLQESGEVVRFMHVDCDLYSSTKDVLFGLRFAIVPGTVILFDEYLNYPGWENGEWLAFDEFCRESGRRYKYLAYNRRHEQVAVVIL